MRSFFCSRSRNCCHYSKNRQPHLVNHQSQLALGATGCRLGERVPRSLLLGYAHPSRASTSAQQPLSPCGRPVYRGAYPSPATGQGEVRSSASTKKGTRLGAFFVLELKSHQLGKALTGNRVFCFTYLHSRKSELAHSNVLDSNTLGDYPRQFGSLSYRL